jgi:proteasome accessory factor C
MTSERTLSRLSRILALIPYVLGKQGAGAGVEEIMDRFGYSEAELARDLDTVFVCGLPGYGPGDLMEAYIDDDEVVIDAADYFERAPRLTPTEAISLLASGMAIVASGQGSPELASAVDKLAKVVVPDAGDPISIDVAAESELLGELRRAASEQKVVTIAYRSLGRETETVREVEPWQVFTTLGNWYLQAYCRLVNDERNFRVDRIRSMQVSKEGFTRPERVPDPSVTYTPSEEDISCDISLGPGAAWVLDYYPVEVIRETKNRTVIRFHSIDAEVPARLLLRLGANARLLKGAEVAKRAREMGSSLLARYQ